MAASDLEAIGDFIARDNPRRSVTFLYDLRDYHPGVAVLLISRRSLLERETELT